MAEIDREKVMTWLEICGENRDCSATCPYGDGSGEYEDSRCRENLMADAITLLKEQEAVIPHIDIDEAKCPICKVKLTRQELIGDNILFEDFFDYCPHCGRRVKWE